MRSIPDNWGTMFRELERRIRILETSSPGVGVGGAGSPPGGNDTNVQFNDGGSFGGSDAFTWDGTNVSVTQGSNGEQYGKNASAGGRSTAVGNGASAGDYDDDFGTDAVAIGYQASAVADYSIAIGANANAGNDDQPGCVALGKDSFTLAADSLAVGTDVNIYDGADEAVAVGTGAYVEEDCSRATALGSYATILSPYGTLIGNTSVIWADSEESVAIGDGAAVGKLFPAIAAPFSVAVGAGVNVEAEGGAVLGYNATIQEDATDGLALGRESEVTGPKGVALGPGVSVGENQMQLGSSEITDLGLGVTPVPRPVVSLSSPTLAEDIASALEAVGAITTTA